MRSELTKLSPVRIGPKCTEGVRRPTPTASGSGSSARPSQRLAQPRHQRLGQRVAGRPVAAQRRPAAGLDGAETVLLLRAVVVLDVAGADHDVADAQRRIEAARHAAQHQRAAVEAVEQQRGGDAGIDLAGARFDEHRLAAGDRAAPEGQAADFARLARLVGEMGELLGQGRYDAQKPVCHG